MPYVILPFESVQCAHPSPAVMVCPASPSILASTVNVIVPGSMSMGFTCFAFLGRMEDTGTRLHWLMPAAIRALSKAFSFDVLLSPVPDTTKYFLYIIFLSRLFVGGLKIGAFCFLFVVFNL